MPNCCALVVSGGHQHAVGSSCKRKARVGSDRCTQHHNLFQADPKKIAIKEVKAFRTWCWFRNVQDLPLDFINQRITLIKNLGTDEVRELNKFPYGEAGPFEQFIRDLEVQVPVVQNVQVDPIDDVEALIDDVFGQLPPLPQHIPMPPWPEIPDFIPPPPVAHHVPMPPWPEIPDFIIREPPPVQRRGGRQRRVNAGELAQFAADKQNIHTVQSVNMTKQVVQRVLNIPVPEEYRWNMNTVSKTVGEILMECRLNHVETVEMMNRYMASDDVYELGQGVYGKVLDGVWQYVRNSTDKADLSRILKQELKDNVGMCAQGNLTRLCNVLSGYMEGVGSYESPAERLGREFPSLMEIEDTQERIKRGQALLREVALPETEWSNWLSALA